MQNNDAIANLLKNVKFKRPEQEAANAPAALPALTEPNIKPGAYTDEWLEQSLKAAGVEVSGSSVKRGIRYYYIRCPNESEHTEAGNATETNVYIYNGYPVFKCHHKHCIAWKFPDYAQAVGIDYTNKTGRVPDKDTHYLSDFYEFSKDGIPTKVIDVNISRWICDNYEFFVLGDLPYFINDSKRYELDEGGARMKRIIQSCIVPRLCKDGTITSIFRLILYQDKRKTYDELNQYPVEWVPFRNGFFDPINNRMIPITPEHFVINQIPHDYDPAASPECPTFDDLLQFQLPDDNEREQWLEYCGSCFTRDTSGQKWMIVRGSGGTGKSTQLNILIDAIGADNIANETLQGLNERFNATALFGKLCNICADISSEDMKRIDVLKKITGQDRNGVKYERKGKDAFFFTPFAKLLFSANEIPLNRDEKSNAFYRRMLITVMDRKPDRVDGRLHEKLLAELDGIIHRYMDALRRLYDRDGRYLESDRSVSEVLELRRSADSVIAFFDDVLVADTSGMIERSRVYAAYQLYCQREERKFPVTNRKLFERLRSMGVTESKTNGGNRYFMGISFKQQDTDFVPVDNASDNPFNTAI